MYHARLTWHAIRRALNSLTSSNSLIRTPTTSQKCEAICREAEVQPSRTSERAKSVGSWIILVTLTIDWPYRSRPPLAITRPLTYFVLRFTVHFLPLSIPHSILWINSFKLRSCTLVPRSGHSMPFAEQRALFPKCRIQNWPQVIQPPFSSHNIWPISCFSEFRFSYSLL